jgi:hypothetical protein
MSLTTLSLRFPFIPPTRFCDNRKSKWLTLTREKTLYVLLSKINVNYHESNYSNHVKLLLFTSALWRLKVENLCSILENYENLLLFY